MPSVFGDHKAHNICSDTCPIREDKSISAGLKDRRLTWAKRCRQSWLNIQKRSVQDVYFYLPMCMYMCVWIYFTTTSKPAQLNNVTEADRQIEVCIDFSGYWQNIFKPAPVFPQCRLVSRILAAPANSPRRAGCQLFCCSSSPAAHIMICVAPASFVWQRCCSFLLGVSATWAHGKVIDGNSLPERKGRREKGNATKKVGKKKKKY